MAQKIKDFIKERLSYKFSFPSICISVLYFYGMLRYTYSTLEGVSPYVSLVNFAIACLCTYGGLYFTNRMIFKFRKYKKEIPFGISVYFFLVSAFFGIIMFNFFFIPFYYNHTVIHAY